MSRAHALGHWLGQLNDAVTVFRFRARQTADDLDECMAHWPDSRGARFTLTVLAPQRDVVSGIASTLERITEETRRTSAAVLSCDDHLEHLRAELDGVQQSCRYAMAAASHAVGDAGAAQSTAAEVETSAAGLVAEAGGIWLPF